jgi:hypothetical protein
MHSKLGLGIVVLLSILLAPHLLKRRNHSLRVGKRSSCSLVGMSTMLASMAVGWIFSFKVCAAATCSFAVCIVDKLGWSGASHVEAGRVQE